VRDVTEEAWVQNFSEYMLYYCEQEIFYNARIIEMSLYGGACQVFNHYGSIKEDAKFLRSIKSPRYLLFFNPSVPNEVLRQVLSKWKKQSSCLRFLVSATEEGDERERSKNFAN